MDRLIKQEGAPYEVYQPKSRESEHVYKIYDQYKESKYEDWNLESDRGRTTNWLDIVSDNEFQTRINEIYYEAKSFVTCIFIDKVFRGMSNKDLSVKYQRSPQQINTLCEKARNKIYKAIKHADEQSRKIQNFNAMKKHYKPLDVDEETKCFLLYITLGLTNQEIADMLEKSVSAVKHCINRAKAKAKDGLFFFKIDDQDNLVHMNKVEKRDVMQQCKVLDK